MRVDEVGRSAAGLFCVGFFRGGVVNVGARRLLCSLFVVIVGVLVFASAPALAAAPETPETGSASAVTANSATLEGGVLNPKAAGEPGEYEYLYKASTSECEGGSVAPVPEGIAAGIEKEAVPSVKLTGLKAAQAYTFCLVERNAANQEEVSPASPPVTFTTLNAQPAIESEYSSYVEASGATLNAQIDADGEATTFYFQYGTSESYGVNTVETALPGNGTARTRIPAAGLAALKPETTYHYRVVAINALSPAGGTLGSDKTFTTPAVLGSEPAQNCANEQRRAEQPYALELPDCRAYEMVSPLDTEGQDATDPGLEQESGPRASVSGGAVTYASSGDFADPEGSGFDNQFLSRRGSEGWSTQEITPVHDPSVVADQEPSYTTSDFTPELTEGIATTSASLTGEAQVGLEQRGLYVDDFASSSYRYVGEVDGGGEPYPVGASTDLTHVVFEPSGNEGSIDKVLEWASGKVVPVNVTNSGESMEASVGSATDTLDFHNEKNAWHAMSADGSRVYFTSRSWAYNGNSNPAPAVLYVRVNAEQAQSPMSGEVCADPNDACTVAVSASQRSIADPHGPQTAHFWGASANGSKVFFTSNAELTENAYTGPADNAANLYEYDLERPAGERLKDLTVDEIDTDGAAVQGVVQISEEGSYVYFVAEGDLATGAVAGEPNLYVSHEGGTPKFIATLATGDNTVWDGGGERKEQYGQEEYKSGPEVNNAVVTPDGTRLAFMSEQSLTGYDNEQAEPGECEGKIGGTDGQRRESGRCQEVYLYDAETGGLACASCNPSGARPVGPSNLTVVGHYNLAEYRARNLLEDGTLFFDSSDALVPHASDGRQNVYEYENGHVYAISNVAGGYESFFMDASANGENVFFGSADQLLPQDTSNNVVVYDARVGGGFPVTVLPPSCDNGDSCKPPPSPQTGVFGAPGSATFSGPGNIAPVVATKPAVKAKAKSAKCKKGYTKKKDKCVKKAKKKAKKAKKSSESKGSK